MEQEGQNWHGFHGQSDWVLPVLVASSTEANRADQGNQTLANEYLYVLFPSPSTNVIEILRKYWRKRWKLFAK
jgi:hypothetical protein